MKAIRIIYFKIKQKICRHEWYECTEIIFKGDGIACIPAKRCRKCKKWEYRDTEKEKQE